MRTASHLVRPLALLLLPHALLAQAGTDRAPRPLPTAGMVEHEESFSRIKNVLGLADGRVVVPDATEKKLVLLDFTNQRATPLSRTGSGPTEFQTPGGVYRGRGGAALVYDQNQRRFLRIEGNGSVAGAVSLPTSPTSMSVSDRGPDQFVPDTLGNVVSQTSTMQTGQIESRLMRFDGDGAERELAKLTMPASRDVGGSTPGVSMRQLVRFSPADVWAVAPDGWVAVVSAAPYRVRWIPPAGSEVQGPALPFTPLPVTKEDRDAARTTTTNRPPATVTTRGPNGDRVVPMPRPNVEPLFADTKPAFGTQVPQIDPTGRIWIERHVAHGAAPLYDVIDRRGNLVDRIVFPMGTRLGGFGPGVLYAVRTDEDDLLYVQRYRMP